MKRTLIVSGISSIILGGLLVGRALYENKVDNNQKHAYEKIHDEKVEKIIYNSKIEGYTILKNTIIEFLNSDEEEKVFEKFLEKQWPSDYKIYQESLTNTTINKAQNLYEKGTSIKRSYKGWRNIFDEVKKNPSLNIDDIIHLGEQNIPQGK
jgi:CRISPR/Cas system CMR-associated protein Cmr5 small subunit